MILRERFKSLLKNLKYIKQERGAVFVLTALLLPVLFGFLGLGYDVGNLYVHKARLQNTADAAALAGARGYVNEMKGTTTGVIALPTESNETLAKKRSAKSKLVSDADSYIANNNPLFQGKLNDAKGKKFYAIGKELTGSDSNKDQSFTEYFRVELKRIFLHNYPSVFSITFISQKSIHLSNSFQKMRDEHYHSLVFIDSFISLLQNFNLFTIFSHSFM